MYYLAREYKSIPALWSLQMMIGRASTPTPTRADLHCLEGQADCEPSQLQCQRGIQWSLQRKTAPENEGMRHTREAAPVDRSILLGMNSNDPNQQAVLWGPKPTTGWSTSRLSIIPNPISLLQCWPSATLNQQPQRSNGIYQWLHSMGHRTHGMKQLGRHRSYH